MRDIFYSCFWILFSLRHTIYDIRYTTYDIRINGGDERDRTAGLRRARAALSQLSYIPISIRCSYLVSGISYFVLCFFTIYDIRYTSKWWAFLELNQAPHAYQACALTNWAKGPSSIRRSYLVSGISFISPLRHTIYDIRNKKNKYPTRMIDRFYSLERRWSSRTFRYGYLVTTSPQSLVIPSVPASPCGVSLVTSGIANFRGVTGGVYKARERIHRGMLIRDY